MADVVSTSTTQTSAAAVGKPVSKQATALTTDFETFLKMLTAQAKYQDPLDPLDSAEYASQLAQFSSVEQSLRTNELLEQLVGKSGSSDLSSFASWIGQDALTSGRKYFDGSPMSLHVPNKDGATSAELVVYNSKGHEVQRRVVDHLADEILWDGADASQQILPQDFYDLKIERYSGETLLNTGAVRSFSTVTEVRLVDGAPILYFSDGTSARPDEATAMR